MNENILRSALITDLEKLFQIEQLIIEYERPLVKNMRTQHFNYYDLEALINSDTAEVVVAEIDGEIVASGYAKIKQSSNYIKHKNHGFLGFMYVAPEHRGKGINQMLVNKLIAWCREKGLVEIRLTVFEGNDSAFRSYEKVGFSKHQSVMSLNL